MTTDLAIDPQLHGSLDLTDPDGEVAQPVASNLWKQFQARAQGGPPTVGGH